jgi:transposase
LPQSEQVARIAWDSRGGRPGYRVSALAHACPFRGKRGDYFKGLRWDGSRMWLIAKRLEKGRFVGRRLSMAR